MFNCTVEPLILLETVSISWTKVTSTGSTFLTSMRTLSLKKLKRSDAGQYTCIGESGGKTSEDSGIITIKGTLCYCFIKVYEVLNYLRF